MVEFEMKSNVEGNYRVVDKIGEGTYGVVYKAVDQRVGERVAIKKVKVRKPEDGLPKELVREIEATNALRNAYGTDLTSLHIVNLREVFLGSTSLNIVYSPYCPELDITSLIGKKLSGEQANDIAKHMLRALAAVHNAKLVHRDIKPSNLLIGPDGIILCDFGQCRVALDTIDSDEARKLADKAQLTLEVGSRWYKSPEQLFGYKKYGQAVDLWAAGCVIAELVIATRQNHD